eukprot:scaffold1.g5244.t1
MVAWTDLGASYLEPLLAAKGYQCSSCGADQALVLSPDDEVALRQQAQHWVAEHRRQQMEALREQVERERAAEQQRTLQEAARQQAAEQARALKQAAAQRQMLQQPFDPIRAAAAAFLQQQAQAQAQQQARQQAQVQQQAQAQQQAAARQQVQQQRRHQAIQQQQHVRHQLLIAAASQQLQQAGSAGLSAVQQRTLQQQVTQAAALVQQQQQQQAAMQVLVQRQQQQQLQNQNTQHHQHAVAAPSGVSTAPAARGPVSGLLAAQAVAQQQERPTPEALAALGLRELPPGVTLQQAQAMHALLAQRRQQELLRQRAAHDQQRAAAAEQAEEEDEGNVEDSEGRDMFMEYSPAKLTLGTPHPDPVVETASLSAVAPPDITYQLKAQKELVAGRRLSALQLEAVVYACQRHELRLPDGARAGFFIGDGAGVGKGRTVAGLILENWRHGRRRHLWLSVGSDLKFDARRDLDDAGASFIELHALNKQPYAKLAGPKVNIKEGVIFLTYSSLIASSDGGRSRLKQLLEWCGSGFDGLIIFDESHKAKNLVGLRVRDLQEKLPGARVVYCSATGASEPRNMGYMVRLGLWGEGHPAFRDFPAFLEAVQGSKLTAGAGPNIAALELVAMDMKAQGMYVCRTLSFAGEPGVGAEFETVEAPLEEPVASQYVAASRMWCELLRAFLEAEEKAQAGLEAAGGDRADGRRTAGIWRSFWGAHQRFFRHMCMAAKARGLRAAASLDACVLAVVRMTQAAIAAGKCVVIGLQSTGAARTADVVAEQGEALEDFVPVHTLVHAGPRELLVRLVEDHYPLPPDPSLEEAELESDEDFLEPKSLATLKARMELLEGRTQLPERTAKQVAKRYKEFSESELDISSEDETEGAAAWGSADGAAAQGSAEGDDAGLDVGQVTEVLEEEADVQAPVATGSKQENAALSQQEEAPSAVQAAEAASSSSSSSSESESSSSDESSSDSEAERKRKKKSSSSSSSSSSSESSSSSDEEEGAPKRRKPAALRGSSNNVRGSAPPALAGGAPAAAAAAAVAVNPVPRRRARKPATQAAQPPASAGAGSSRASGSRGTASGGRGGAGSRGTASTGGRGRVRGRGHRGRRRGSATLSGDEYMPDASELEDQESSSSESEEEGEEEGREEGRDSEPTRPPSKKGWLFGRPLPSEEELAERARRRAEKEAAAAVALAAKAQRRAEMEARFEEAVRRKTALRDAVAAMDLPINPLDLLIDQLGGPDQARRLVVVAEMTGRKGRLVRIKSSKSMGEGQAGQAVEGGVKFEARNVSGMGDKGASLELINVRERELFLEGQKLVAIISEAASAGISLHADRRAKNQRRRVHLTLELPWSADKAIQQFGRSHRANQSSAPQYRLIFTPLGGERRFAAAVARRLASLGALTQGDRRAGPSLSAFNYESVWGQRALREMYAAVLEDRRPAVTPVPCRPGPSGEPPAIELPVFLGRCRAHLLEAGLLKSGGRGEEGAAAQRAEWLDSSEGVPRGCVSLEEKDRGDLFDFYQATLEALMDRARKEGTLDEGIVDLRAHSVSVNGEPRVLHRDTISGAATMLYAIRLDRGLPWEAALAALEEHRAEEAGGSAPGSTGKQPQQHGPEQGAAQQQDATVKKEPGSADEPKENGRLDVGGRPVELDGAASEPGPAGEAEARGADSLVRAAGRKCAREETPAGGGFQALAAAGPALGVEVKQEPGPQAAQQQEQEIGDEDEVTVIVDSPLQEPVLAAEEESAGAAVAATAPGDQAALAAAAAEGVPEPAQAADSGEEGTAVGPPPKHSRLLDASPHPAAGQQPGARPPAAEQPPQPQPGGKEQAQQGPKEKPAAPSAAAAGQGSGADVIDLTRSDSSDGERGRPATGGRGKRRRPSPQRPVQWESGLYRSRAAVTGKHYVLLALRVPAAAPPAFVVHRPGTGRSRALMPLRVRGRVGGGHGGGPPLPWVVMRCWAAVQRVLQRHVRNREQRMRVMRIATTGEAPQRLVGMLVPEAAVEEVVKGLEQLQEREEAEARGEGDAGSAEGSGAAAGGRGAAPAGGGKRRGRPPKSRPPPPVAGSA